MNMRNEDIFAVALGLSKPWFIEQVNFEQSEDGYVPRLRIKINFTPGAKFIVNGEAYTAYDTVQRSWRHMNFFQHECYIDARVPRVKTNGGNTLIPDVPWARPGSSFTLLFEAFAMSLVKNSMSLQEAGRTMNVDGRVIGRIIRSYVEIALCEDELNEVESITVDETSVKKGHNYVTILTNIKEKKVVGVGVGRDASAFKQALTEMESRKASKEAIKHVAMDMSPSYIAATADLLPQAQRVYDRFHLEQMLSKAVDSVRKREAVAAKELKKTKYLWLRNASNLNERQSEKIIYLAEIFPNIGKAYRLKESFKEIFNNAAPHQAADTLSEWLEDAERTNLPEIINFCQSVRKHWNGIISFFNLRLTSAIAERINLKIQEIKRSAKGYRNMKNFIAMIYFHLGKLPIPTHN